MNRKQRRAQAKRYNTPAKFDAMIQNERKYMQQDLEMKRSAIVEVVLTMTAYTLEYKLGLGKKRLPKIMNDILFNIDAFNTGHLTHADFREIQKDLEEKYEMRF